MLLPPNAKRFTFWAVLGAGIFLGAAAASGHATSPPGVNNPGTTAGQASVAPDASLQHRLSAASNTAPGASTPDALRTPTGTRLAEPAQKALSTPASPAEDALVFMDSPKASQACFISFGTGLPEPATSTQTTPLHQQGSPTLQLSQQV